MRIDKTHNLDPLTPPESRPGGAPSAASAKKAGSEAAVDSSQIRAESQPYIRQALEVPEMDQQAIEQARALLQAGQLDSPAALERLAQKLIDLGA